MNTTNRVKRIAPKGIYVIVDAELQEAKGDKHIYYVILNKPFKRCMEDKNAFELVGLALGCDSNKRVADLVSANDRIVVIDLFNVEDPVKPGDLLINVQYDINKICQRARTGYYEDWKSSILKKYQCVSAR